MESATAEQFTAFLTKYGYTVTTDSAPFLALSHAFMRSLPFADVGKLDAATAVEAQCFIAYAMVPVEEGGGGFNPAAIAEAKTLTKKGLGRSAIVKEWKVNDLLSGNDPLSLLRSMAIPYGLLKDYLCVGTAGVFVV